MLDHIFGKTPYPIPAHFHLAAVGIIDLHLEVSDLGGMNRKELICPDAAAPVAESLRDPTKIWDLVPQKIQHDEVIPTTLHFGKGDLCHLPFNL